MLSVNYDDQLARMLKPKCSIKAYTLACALEIFTYDELINANVDSNILLKGFTMLDRTKFLTIVYATSVKFGFNEETDHVCLRKWIKDIIARKKGHMRELIEKN